MVHAFLRGAVTGAMLWHLLFWTSVFLDITLALILGFALAFFLFCCVMLVFFHAEVRNGYARAEEIDRSLELVLRARTEYALCAKAA